MAQEITAGWGWWHSRHEDSGCSGPYATRDEAIAEAVGSGEYADDGDNGGEVHHFWVCEAKQEPLRLADWIDTNDMLERADESLADSDRVGSEGDEGPWFEATPEQETDLAKRIKAACNDWQAAHGLTFNCRTFSHCRNMAQVRHEVQQVGEGETNA